MNHRKKIVRIGEKSKMIKKIILIPEVAIYIRRIQPQKQENKHKKLLNMLIAEGRRKSKVNTGQ